MMEILTESSKFYTTRRRLLEQAKLVLKKVWLFDLEILEICQHINLEEYTQKEPSLNKLKQNQTTKEPSTTTSILTPRWQKKVKN